MNFPESNHGADARVLKMQVRGQGCAEAVAIRIRHVIRDDSPMNDLPVMLGRPRCGPDSRRTRPRRVHFHW